MNATGRPPRSLIVTALLVLVLPVVVVVSYLLWRADILPGVWDLQHWGRNMELEAATERSTHRDARLAGFRGEDTPPAAIVFLGSSTIERLSIEEQFGAVPGLNRGVGDEPAGQLLERLDVGIDWERVAGVVLYAGSVDLRRLGATPEEVRVRVARLFDALAERAPARPVLLLGLLSERGLTTDGRERLQNTNALLGKLAAERGATFLVTDRPPLTARSGRLERDYSADRLHLNTQGYQVLANWIRQDGGPLAPLLTP